MTTPIDRESVERWECSACPRTMDPEMVADPLGDWVRYEDFRAALDAAEAEIERMLEALQSIASNTCCNTCQEAALVARSALQEKHEDWCASLNVLLTSNPPKPAACNCGKENPDG